MNNETFGAGFGALTEEEQVSLVGGDGAFARMIGYGIGFAAHWMEAAILVGLAMDPTYRRQTAYGYFANL